MSGSFALRKILFSRSDEHDITIGGYHTSGCYEGLVNGLQVENTCTCPPRSGIAFSCVCLASCFLTCAFMKNRNKEKWWLGVLFMTGMYYNSMKAHKAGNGLVGHQCGFFAAGMGAVGCTARLIAHNGSQRWNGRMLLLFLTLMWYEVGRFHLWAEHAVEYKKEVSPGSSMDLLHEYVPQNLEVAFLPYRPVS